MRTSVFAAVPRVKTLYADLARAGLERATPQGVLDFHSLTYGTLLARAGVPLQHAQQLMRHSDPRLTANVYTWVESEDHRRAAERLGGLLRRARSGDVDFPAGLPDEGRSS